MYRLRVLGQWFDGIRFYAAASQPKEVASHLGRASVVVLLQHPLLVVRPLELKQSQAELLDRLENPYPQDVFLQRADEALRDTVAFGLPHEARRAFDAEERDLLLEIVGQIVRPVVVPETPPAGHAFADAPEAFPDALANRLQGLEAVPALGGMEPDALGRAVIDGHEDEGYPLGDGHGGRHVRAPHHVGRLGGDGPVVRLWPVRVARALRGLEAGLPHQPPHPFLRGPNPVDPQLRPGLPVPLAMKTARLRAPGECGPPGRRPGQRRSARGDDTAQGTVSPAAAHTHWSGRGATRGRPAARHTPDGWRSTGRHSSRRPPPGQRAAGLQLVHLRVQ